MLFRKVNAVVLLVRKIMIPERIIRGKINDPSMTPRDVCPFSSLPHRVTAVLIALISMQ